MASALSSKRDFLDAKRHNHSWARLYRLRRLSKTPRGASKRRQQRGDVVEVTLQKILIKNKLFGRARYVPCLLVKISDIETIFLQRAGGPDAAPTADSMRQQIAEAVNSGEL